MPAWVHYKLDLGIDHVLIDEAQDTSPKQWEVIERLVAEFAAGARRARSVTRSIFAVGDDKQSIFSFQGAEPEASTTSGAHFEARYEASGLAFRPSEFKYSFRSGADRARCGRRRCSSSRQRSRGLTADPVPDRARRPCARTRRAWSKSGRPAEPDEKAEIEGWDAPSTPRSETSPRVKLARQIANTVKLDRARRPRRRWRQAPSDAPATCWCWCASAARCSRRSSAR